MGVKQPQRNHGSPEQQVPRAQAHQRPREHESGGDKVQDAEPDEARSEHRRAAHGNQQGRAGNLAPTPPEIGQPRFERGPQYQSYTYQQQKLRNDAGAPSDPRLVRQHAQSHPPKVVQIIDEVIDDHLRDREAAQDVDEGQAWRGAGSSSPRFDPR